MKSSVMAGALALGLWGGLAAAQGEVEEETEVKETQVVVVDEEPRSETNMRGVTFALGGGVEGYTGGLAPQVNPGPAWGANVALRPTKLIGLEFGYSGAVNELDIGGSGFNNTGGADIVRNGGHAIATIGLTPTAIQPYVLGGIGINWYNVRGAQAGFQDDTSGSVPLGAGLRTHIGNFTADLRADFNVLFDNDFALRTGEADIAGVDTTINGGRYQGMLALGGTF